VFPGFNFLTPFEKLKGVINSLQHYILSNSYNRISDNTFNLQIVLALQVKTAGIKSRMWDEAKEKSNERQIFSLTCSALIFNI